MDRTMTLLARYRSGDRAALQTLFERYYLRVLRLVRIELGTAPPPGQEVADVLQEVFVRILEGLEGYEPRTDAQWISWVATLARNRIANLRRDAHAAKRGGGRRPQSIQTESGSYISAIADSSGIVAKVALTEDMERIDACVNQLTGDQREVVLQRDYQGASWKEIASRMERSTKACEQLHRRARAELSRLFRE